MNSLLNLITWDAKLLLRYGIVYVALGIALLYIIGIVWFSPVDMDEILLTMVFSDPVMYGFLFTAVIVLFEKDVNIHQVYSVTALPKFYYLLSKAIVFALLALLCCIPIMLSYTLESVNWLLYILAIVLSASLFSFIGILGALYVKTFNQFILTIPIVMAPTCLPFLSFYDVWHSPLFYLIPTQASLLLFKSVLIPQSFVAIAYAILYLLVWNVFAFYWANKILQSKF